MGLRIKKGSISPKFIKKSKHLWKTISKMLTIFKLSPEELDKLNYERYHYPCPIVQKRLHCIYLKAVSGYSNEKIGKLMDAHRNSISEWVHTYQQDGYDALVRVGYGTNQSVLENLADKHYRIIYQPSAAQPVRGRAQGKRADRYSKKCYLSSLIYETAQVSLFENRSPTCKSKQHTAT